MPDLIMYELELENTTNLHDLIGWMKESRPRKKCFEESMVISWRGNEWFGKWFRWKKSSKDGSHFFRDSKSTRYAAVLHRSPCHRPSAARPTPSAHRRAERRERPRSCRHSMTAGCWRRMAGSADSSCTAAVAHRASPLCRHHSPPCSQRHGRRSARDLDADTPSWCSTSSMAVGGARPLPHRPQRWWSHRRCRQ